MMGQVSVTLHGDKQVANLVCATLLGHFLADATIQSSDNGAESTCRIEITIAVERDDG